MSIKAPLGCCSEAAASGPLPTSSTKEIEFAELARALGHPARVRILRVLIAESTCIAGDLQAEVGLAASTVSQHLKALKQAQWVRGEVDGPHRCYCINPETLARFRALCDDLL